ncbi:MAG: hypothetical protein ABI885_22200, partial [Gammaproteobacteria bacterium]
MAMYWPAVLIGTAFGGLVSWLLAHAHYRRGTTNSNRTLRTLQTVALQMERQNLLKLARDSRGNITDAELLIGAPDPSLADMTGAFVGSYIP